MCVPHLWSPPYIGTVPRATYYYSWVPSALEEQRAYNPVANLYQSLKLVLRGFGVPLQVAPRVAISQYTPFYHVYKPSTTFKKTSPPPPDFHIVIVK